MPVPPFKGEIYRLAFGSAGMVAHPNRWLSQPNELLVAQNVTFENDLVQKAAASADYDSSGIASEAPNGTFSGNTDSTFAAIWLPAPTGAVFGAQIASTAFNTTSPANAAISTSAAAGSLVVVALGQRINKTDFPMATSVTDSQLNTYTRQKTTAGNASILSDVEIWTSILTTGLTNVDTLFVAYTTLTADDRAICAASFTGVSGAATEAVAASFFDNLAVFSSNTNAYIGHTFPALLVAAVHWPQLNTTTATWLGGFTQRAAASSGAVLTQISLASKAVAFSTAIAAQVDWNPEGFSTPGGTVTTVAGSTTVVGVATSFQTNFVPGDEIVIAGETHIVNQITSNTVLDTLDAWTAAFAGVAYQLHTGPRVITATLAGNVYRDLPDPGGNTGNLDFTSLKTGLTTSRDYRGRFIQGGKEVAANNRKLFYFNGADPVQVLSGNGATMTAIATPPADWDTVQNPSKQPINGIVHLGHLIGFGNTNDPHRIYISDASNHELFTGANAFQFSIASNIGERLWGSAEFQGVCWFWKYPVGIFYLDDTDASFLNWSFHVRSEALGCARSPYAVLPIDDDVLFCNADGHFHLLSAVSTLGGQRTSDITRMLGLHGFTRDIINTNALNTLTSTWDPVTKEACFGLRSKTATSTDNDLLFRFDFGLVNRGGPIRFHYDTIYRPNALTVKRRDYNGRQALLIGETSTSSFVNPFAYGFRTQIGVTTGFSHTVRTPQLDFSDVEPTMKFRRKHYDALELVLSDPSVLVGNPLSVGIYVDNVLRQTLSFTNSSRRPIQQLHCGDGYEFAIACTSASGSITDIPQIGALVYWRPGGQDKSRAA